MDNQRLSLMLGAGLLALFAGSLALLATNLPSFSIKLQGGALLTCGLLSLAIHGLAYRAEQPAAGRLGFLGCLAGVLIGSSLLIFAFTQPAAAGGSPSQMLQALTGVRDAAFYGPAATGLVCLIAFRISGYPRWLLVGSLLLASSIVGLVVVYTAKSGAPSATLPMMGWIPGGVTLVLGIICLMAAYVADQQWDGAAENLLIASSILVCAGYTMLPHTILHSGFDATGLLITLMFCGLMLFYTHFWACLGTMAGLGYAVLALTGQLLTAPHARAVVAFVAFVGLVLVVLAFANLLAPDEPLSDEIHIDLQ